MAKTCPREGGHGTRHSNDRVSGNDGGGVGIRGSRPQIKNQKLNIKIEVSPSARLFYWMKIEVFGYSCEWIPAGAGMTG